MRKIPLEMFERERSFPAFYFTSDMAEETEIVTWRREKTIGLRLGKNSSAGLSHLLFKPPYQRCEARTELMNTGDAER